MSRSGSYAEHLLCGVERPWIDGVTSHGDAAWWNPQRAGCRCVGEGGEHRRLHPEAVGVDRVQGLDDRRSRPVSGTDTPSPCLLPVDEQRRPCRGVAQRAGADEGEPFGRRVASVGAEADAAGSQPSELVDRPWEHAGLTGRASCGEHEVRAQQERWPNRFQPGEVRSSGSQRKTRIGDRRGPTRSSHRPCSSSAATSGPFRPLYGSRAGGSRTPNLLIRSQMLYPLSYERSRLRTGSLRGPAPDRNPRPPCVSRPGRSEAQGSQPASM